MTYKKTLLFNVLGLLLLGAQACADVETQTRTGVFIGLGGASQSDSRLQDKDNDTEQQQYKAFLGYQAGGRWYFLAELLPSQERWRQNEVCDPVSCYQLNLKATTFKLMAGWHLHRFQIKQVPSYIAVGFGYARTSARLEVEERFRTFPEGRSGLKDSVNGADLHLMMGMRLPYGFGLRFGWSYTFNEKLYSDTSRPLTFDESLTGLELLYRF